MVKLRHRQPMQGSENTRCPANRSAMWLSMDTVRRATRKAHLLLLYGTFVYFALDCCATLAIVCKLVWFIYLFIYLFIYFEAVVIRASKIVACKISKR